MHYSFNSRAAKVGLLVSVAGFGLAGCRPGGTGASGAGGSSTGGETLATVGTTQLTRTQLADFLIAQGGQQALPYLIDTQLLIEALKAKGLDVTDAEVDADLARRQETDPSIATLISTGGSKFDAAKRQVKRELAVQKLLTAGVTASDAQIKSFYTKNHQFYDAPAKVKVGVLFASTKVRADLMARQLAQKTKTFEALVAEQKAVKDPVASQSSADSGRFDVMTGYPPAVRTQLEKMAKGAVTTPQQVNVGLPTPVFVIFRKVDFQPAKKADLTALKAQIEMDYKLAEIAKKAVNQNPKNPPFETTLVRTQTFLQTQNQQQNPSAPAPTLRDVLTFINQSASQALLVGLRAAGTVQVNDPAFAEVAQQYQAAKPGASGTPGAAGATGTENSASENTTAENTAAAPSETTSPAERPANDKDTASNGADKAAPLAQQR